MFTDKCPWFALFNLQECRFIPHALCLRCSEGVEPSVAHRSAGLAEGIAGNLVFIILGAIIKMHG